MNVLSTAAFERRLGNLSEDEFAAFVANLWAARGADVRIEGDVVLVPTADGGEPRRLYVAYCDGPLSLRSTASVSAADVREAGADALVTNADSDCLRTVAAEAGTGFMGPERLRQLALYAVDRDRCREVFETYFGRPIREQQSREVPSERVAWMAERMGSECVPFPSFRPVERVGSRTVVSVSLTVLLTVGLAVVLFAPGYGVGSLGEAREQATPGDAGSIRVPTPTRTSRRASGRTGSTTGRHSSPGTSASSPSRPRS